MSYNWSESSGGMLSQLEVAKEDGRCMSANVQCTNKHNTIWSFYLIMEFVPNKTNQSDSF